MADSILDTAGHAPHLNTSNPNSVSNSLPSTGNPVLDDMLQIMVRRFEVLVSRGFLAPHFLEKMRKSPNEVIKFLRSNRSVVAETLQKRLSHMQRPTRLQLEQQGIVPRGYFHYGHELAMQSRHRRKSTVGQDLERMIKLRPNKEEIVMQGVVKRRDMQDYFELDESKLGGPDVEQDNAYYEVDLHMTMPVMRAPPNSLHPNELFQQQQSPPQQPAQAHDIIDLDRHDDTLMNGNDKMATTAASAAAGREGGGGLAVDAVSADEIWEISVLQSLLFRTISEALKKACEDTQQQESVVLQEIVEMNGELRALRNVLDKYFLSDNLQEVVMHQDDENMVRDKFHVIQEKLLHISGRQQRIREKLRILQSVEGGMAQLQNHYKVRLSMLRKKELRVLRDLRLMRLQRDRATKIMYAERSHKSWAMTKLDYTIHVAKAYNEQRTHNASTSTNQTKDLDDDIAFVNELETFLRNLRNISEHQRQLCRDFDDEISGMESQLMSVRVDMGRVRESTFKKIYELHKEIQIAESLEFGHRRLSVASPTELHKERRHHAIKIQRQLHTLHASMETTVRYEAYAGNLREMIDVQFIMSHAKLKAFFAVYLQTTAQTIFDIELTFNNLNSELPPDDGGAVTSICDSLYGIEEIVEKCVITKRRRSAMYQHDENYGQGLSDRLSKCAKFLKLVKKAIKLEREQKERTRERRRRAVADRHGAAEQKYDDDDEEEEDENEANGMAALHADNPWRSSSSADKKPRKKKRKKKRGQVKTMAVNNVFLIVARKVCIHCAGEIEHKGICGDAIPAFAVMKMREIWECLLNGNKIFKAEPISKLDAAAQILHEVYDIELQETTL